MLKTQESWRPFNHPGEPVSETDDPRSKISGLAPQPMYGRRQLPSRECGPTEYLSTKSGRYMANGQEQMGYNRYNDIQDSILNYFTRRTW